MSEPYEPWAIGPFACPFCGEPDQEVEDLGDHPAFLSGECGNCGKMFSVDTVREEWYDHNGNTIKPGKVTP